MLLLLLLLRGGILPAGPAFVYGCYWGAVPAYIMAELLGGVAAALVSWPLYGTGLQLGRCAGLQWLLKGDAATSYALARQQAGRPVAYSNRVVPAQAVHLSVLHLVWFNLSAHCCRTKRKHPRSFMPPHRFAVCAGGGTWRMTRPGVATSASRAPCTERSRRKGCGRC